jgi:hypothetical protein
MDAALPFFLMGFPAEALATQGMILVAAHAFPGAGKGSIIS